MENNDRNNNSGNAANNLPPTPDTPNEQSKKLNKPRRAPRKANENKKKSYRRSWRSASPIKKVEIVIAAIVVAGAIGYLGVTIWGILQTKWNFQAEHRPRVIVSRPPDLVGTFNCQVTKRELYWHAGVTHVWVKDISKGDASGAFVIGPQFKPVLEKKIGDHFYDDPPIIEEQTCLAKVEPKMSPFPVHGDEELSVNLRQSAGTLSLFKGTQANISFGGPQDENKIFPGENAAERIPVDNGTFVPTLRPSLCLLL
jgi:hypothetical protein